jgi:glucosyl-3-phosphoglycerate synthase
MWQGLAATSSDVVVFADADVHDVPPAFVAPLLVPLLQEPDVLLAKAAYDRPLATGPGPQRARGGGRVTELLARPVIALLWPELDFLAQPLSGEYAGRRSLLASVPFVQGYGVELGLLVDTVHAHGPAAIREVDLGRRVHAHQPLDALGRMATEILAVALERATAQGRTPLDQPVLRQPVRDDTGALVLESHPVTVRRRPPLDA